MAQLINIEAFIWATGAFCQLNRIPHDAALLIKQYPPPYDVVNLQQDLNSFGLNNSFKQYDLNQLPNAALPCLAILNSTVDQTLDRQSDEQLSADSQSTPPPKLSSLDQAPLTCDIALILSRDAQRLLVLYPNQAEPATVGLADFSQCITGDFLMVRKVDQQ